MKIRSDTILVPVSEMDRSTTRLISIYIGAIAIRIGAGERRHSKCLSMGHSHSTLILQST
jgi:hypothetical protein